MPTDSFIQSSLQFALQQVAAESYLDKYDFSKI
jgi:hypothetical protein